MADRRGFLKFLGLGAVSAPAAVSSVAKASAEIEKAKKAGNPFNIPLEIIPKGVKYEWKRVFITSGEEDVTHLANLVAAGWKPVPVSRHREVFGSDWHNWIEVGGLVLMEKHIERTKKKEMNMCGFMPFEAKNDGGSFSLTGEVRSSFGPERTEQLSKLLSGKL